MPGFVPNKLYVFTLDQQYLFPLFQVTKDVGASAEECAAEV